VLLATDDDGDDVSLKPNIDVTGVNDGAAAAADDDDDDAAAPS
jgi:hypothetical protein